MGKNVGKKSPNVYLPCISYPLAKIPPQFWAESVSSLSLCSPFSAQNFIISSIILGRSGLFVRIKAIIYNFINSSFELECNKSVIHIVSLLMEFVVDS